jgi:hypothetical protein
MSGLIILLAIISGFAVLAAFALAIGVDTRPDFDDPRAPVGGLTV